MELEVVEELEKVLEEAFDWEGEPLMIYGVDVGVGYELSCRQQNFKDAVEYLRIKLRVHGLEYIVGGGNKSKSDSNALVNLRFTFTILDYMKVTSNHHSADELISTSKVR